MTDMGNRGSTQSDLRARSVRRRVPIVAVVLIGLVLTIAAHYLARSWELRNFDREFARLADNHLVVMQTSIDQHIEVLDSLAGLYSASEQVSRSEFRRFVSPILTRHPELQGLGWNPRIPHAQREAFERKAREEGLQGFRITELDASGARVAAGARAAYVPAYFLEPLAGNEQALGYDIASEQARREALDEARELGRAATTRWIRLVQETGDQYGMLVVKPVYGAGRAFPDAQERQGALRGYVIGVFRIGDLLEEALLGAGPVPLDVQVFEQGAGRADVMSYLHPSPSPDGEAQQPSFARVAAAAERGQSLLTLELPGKQWPVAFSPSAEFVAAQRQHVANGVFLAGASLTALLGFYLLGVKRDAERTGALNKMLAAANDDLQREIIERRETEKALSTSDQIYRALVEYAPEAITILDVERGHMSEANRQAVQLFGMSREHLLSIGPAQFSPEYQPDGRRSAEAAMEYIQRAVEGELPVFEWMHVDVNGREIPCEVRLLRLPDPDRVLVRGTMVDITERLAAESALRESESYNRTLFEESPIGLLLCDMHGTVVDANVAFATIIGRSVEETKGLTCSQITPDPFLHQELVQLESLNPDGRYGPDEREFLHKDGHLVPIRLTGRILLKDGKRYIWSSVEDITDYKQARERIDHLAFHDGLTDLPTRELLCDRLEHAIRLAQRNQTLVGVMFLDIDRFKNINDSLGHGCGDELLTQLADRLQGSVRESDTVARFGGDEFIVVAEGLMDRRQLETMANTLIDAIRAPFKLGDRDLFVTTSIGLSVGPADGVDAEGLIAQADIAMYKAKESGRNTYRFHSYDMGARASARAAVERDLRGALERDELLLYLQPIWNLDEQQLIGMEALMRWNHPQRGLVPAAEFICVMEEAGLIVPASHWILEQACRYLAGLREVTEQPLSIAVNFSAHCFYDSGISDHVEKTLREHGLAPSDLIIEVTESTLFQDPLRVNPVLQRLKDLGVQIALDDFGTGQSSLSHLRYFPIDIVKIDRAFIRDIPGDSNDCELVSAIIAMAQSLNKCVVAEGVETEEQAEFLRARGCDRVQGYLFSPPLPGERMREFLASSQQVMAAVASE